MIIFVLIFLFIPFLLSGIYWYKGSSRIIKDNVIGYTQRMASLTNSHLNDYFTQLDNITSPILTSPLVKGFLEADPNDNYSQYKWNQQIVAELFPYILRSRSDVVNMAIVSNNGTVISSYLSSSSLDAYQKYSNIQIEGENFNIAGIRMIGNSNIPVLTITRKLIDPYSLQTEGMLIIDLNYQKFAKLIENIKLGQSDLLVIVNESGNIVYHPDDTKWGKPIQEALPDYKVMKGNGWYINSANPKKLIVYNRLESVNWELTDEVPLNELYGSLNRINDLTLTIGILLIILALILMYAFTASMTHSISILRRLMKQAELGDLTHRAPQRHHTVEMTGLYHSFNKMVSELKRLMEVVHLTELKEKSMELKQLESRLMLLQFQINPHFLYNSLEVVNSYAIEAGNKPVSKMVTYIAKLLRFNVGDLSVKISLAKEFEHMLLYLMIQKERYGDLELDIQVDENSLQHVETVRLVLQPIVENAFKHGYEKHLNNSKYLGVSGRFEENAYVLTIKDKSQGMDANVMKALNEKFTQTSFKQMAAENRIIVGKGTGLWNVHSRLRLTFGDPYGLYIRKSDQDGSEIEISFPRRDSDVQCADS
jgi:two-component system sensor histidine kinase YesM